jgi:L-2-hydroxycarboxylate dehydrogenase (NAD+)
VSDTRVPAAVLRDFAARVFGEVGLPEADAARVAELMVAADLSGAEGHGIFRLPQYVRRIQAGGVNVRPRITSQRTAPATALVDGDNGMGHLVMSRAADLAVEIAREAGVGWVGVRMSNHAGPAALYATVPLAHDMVGVYMAVANANHMPPWGGRESVLGTNPIAIAVPTRDEPPFVLDMATTVVSYGTVKKHVQRGLPLEAGWMVTAEGEAVLDPARVAEGFLLPIGGYKGSGLAIGLGLLAGVLNGAAFGRDVIDFNADDRRTTNTGVWQFSSGVEHAAEALLQADADLIVRLGRQGHTQYPLPLRTRFHRNLGYATMVCARAVDRLTLSVGAHNIDENNPVHRASRDVHAVANHTGLQWDNHAEMYGRVATGLEPIQRRAFPIPI